MYRRPSLAAATSDDPLPMNGSSTRSPAKVYRRMSCSGSSTGNGAGWPTRLALSVGIDHTSSVRFMKSSVSTSLTWGRPSLARWATDRARSKRPLLATMTRSVMSRSTGLAALRNEPQAHDPLAPSAFCQISSPRSSRPRSCSRMRITSADRLRYGLRPRLATLTAMRPPGSRVRTHSAKTAVSMSRYSRYDDGTPSRSSSSSYCLPAKYGGEVTTRATEPSATASMCLASPWTNGWTTGAGGGTELSVDTVGGRKRS